MGERLGARVESRSGGSQAANESRTDASPVDEARRRSPPRAHEDFDLHTITTTITIIILNGVSRSIVKSMRAHQYTTQR